MSTDHESITSILKNSVEKIDHELDKSKIDIETSGSTCCLALIKDKQLFLSNTGDSRAILLNFSDFPEEHLITFDNPMPKNYKLRLSSIECTKDHNFKIDSEYRRILTHGGRIERMSGDIGNSTSSNLTKIGPLRVWLRNESKPGLAMTRSIGDTLAKTVGVISTPEITSFELTHKCSVLVIGSDGLFEFLSHDEIADVIQGPQHQASYHSFD
jgi:serine/threonine protein phosphatase PrpC